MQDRFQVVSLSRILAVKQLQELDGKTEGRQAITTREKKMAWKEKYKHV